MNIASLSKEIVGRVTASPTSEVAEGEVSGVLSGFLSDLERHLVRGVAGEVVMASDRCEEDYDVALGAAQYVQDEFRKLYEGGK